MASHNISRADVVKSGNAQPPNRSLIGVPVNNVVYETFAPTVADVDGICAAQAVAGAANATINGALAASGAVTLDVERGVQVDSSDAGDTTQTVTIYGTDRYGAAVVETIALNGTTDVQGVKAFKTVTRVAVSAALTGNLTVGTTKKIGLAYAPIVGGFIRGRTVEDTADAGTYVAPSRVTATATTTNVRGTYAPAGTLDGTATYTVIYIAKNGPNDSDAFGVAQYGG